VTFLRWALIGAALITSSYIAAASCKEVVHNDSHLYSLPYASHESYRMLQGFGSRFSHTGQEEFAVDIDMPVGTPGEYYHLRKGGSLVNVGDAITQGQQIGYSGNTGHTTMPHLHFAVYCAVGWGSTQSIPVRFQSANGIIDRPRRGVRYKAL